nr:hypothetical protein [Tanacetum cinerariifolium]
MDVEKQASADDLKMPDVDSDSAEAVDKEKEKENAKRTMQTKEQTTTDDVKMNSCSNCSRIDKKANSK